MKHIQILIVFTFLAFNTFGQVSKRKNYFPIWTFHQDSVNIHGISLGLWTISTKNRQTNTNGLKLEIIGIGVGIPIIPSSPIAENDSTFLEIFKSPISERINGLNLSTTGTVCDCLTNGLTAGFIGQINRQVNGISASTIMNFTQKHNGIMIAMMNDAYSMNGLQIGLGNSGYKNKGIQIGGLVNGSKEMRGLQIGLINKSEILRGIQIGLWNVNERRKLPFINWNFKQKPD